MIHLISIKVVVDSFMPLGPEVCGISQIWSSTCPVGEGGTERRYVTCASWLVGILVTGGVTEYWLLVVVGWVL